MPRLGNPAWVKGQSANPTGRPKGAKHKIAGKFLEYLQADFEKHGVDAIERMRLTDVSAYCKMVAGLIPQQITDEDGEPMTIMATVRFVKPDAA